MSYGHGSYGDYWNEEPWGNTRFGEDTIGRASSVVTPSYTSADFKQFRSDKKEELLRYNNTYPADKKKNGHLIWQAEEVKNHKRKEKQEKQEKVKEKQNVIVNIRPIHLHKTLIIKTDKIYRILSIYMG